MSVSPTSKPSPLPSPLPRPPETYDAPAPPTSLQRKPILLSSSPPAPAPLQYDFSKMTFAILSRNCTVARCALRRRLAVPVTAPTSTAAPRRFMGGGSHQPISRSMEAELFGGHPKHEGWETTIYVTYAASLVLMTFALGFAPDTSIKTWASSEARARLALQAQGKLDQPVFGVHYDTPENKYEFESRNPDNPFDEDDDDDDDEDEDEEEEEGEEEEDDE